MPIQAQIDGIGTLEFPDGTSPDVVHATVQKVVMRHNAPKPLSGAETPVPAGLAGPKDPEYKPFFSGDEARDELSGLGKSVTPAVAIAGKLLGKVPGIGQGVIDPQKVHDLEEYSKPANKGETFGKVAGTGLGAIGAIAAGAPALTAAGDFGGGLVSGAAEELSHYPVLGNIASHALPVAKTVGKEALRALLYKSVLGGLLH